MKTRIFVGVLLCALFLGAVALGKTAQLILITLAALIAVYEMRWLFHDKEIKPMAAPAFVFAAFFAVLYSLWGIGAVLLLAMLCVCVTVIDRILTKVRTTPDCMAALFLYVYPLSFFVCLGTLPVMFPQKTAVSALLLAFAGPLVGDTLAYFIGSFFGKHKLCPNISPKKTVEGSIASILGGVIGGLLVFIAEPIWSGDTSLAALLILGGLCGIFGQFGDLFASTLKRWAGRKDFGTLFPGHGGVLDRLDSVLFCAPLIAGYYYIVSLVA